MVLLFGQKAYEKGGELTRTNMCNLWKGCGECQEERGGSWKDNKRIKRSPRKGIRYTEDTYSTEKGRGEQIKRKVEKQQKGRKRGTGRERQKEMGFSERSRTKGGGVKF